MHPSPTHLWCQNKSFLWKTSWGFGSSWLSLWINVALSENEREQLRLKCSNLTTQMVKMALKYLSTAVKENLRGVWVRYLLLVCTMSSWWQQSLCCEMKTSVEIPVDKKICYLRASSQGFFHLSRTAFEWFNGGSPSHTVDTFLSDASCGPSGVAQHWTENTKWCQQVRYVL